MKRTLTLALAFLAALSLVIISGCGQKDGDGSLRFMFWGDVAEIEIINAAISEFQNDTGIEVNTERAPSGPPYMEKVLTQFAGGNPPDVIFVEVNNFKQFAERGVLEDLSPYLANEKAFSKDDFYKEIMDRFTVDGKMYVLPRDIAPICVMYYNKKLFDEAGLRYPKDNWDYKDFLNTAKKLVKRDAGGRIIQFGYVDDWPLWEPWVLTFGGSIVDNVQNPTKCTLDSPEAIAGIQFRSDLINKYKVAPSPSQMTAMGGMGTADMFVSGDVGLFLSGIWKTPNFRQIRNFQWDVVMFPKGPKGQRSFTTGGSGYSVVKASKNKEAAWKLVTYLAGKKGQVKLAQTGLAQPAMKEIAESKHFLDGRPPANKKIVLDAVKHVEFMPLLPEWEEINVSMLAPNFDRIWSGKSKAENVLKKIVPEINENYFE
ncbi:MAG: ABC transporter substrate-binding protein [Candidatus Goldiibacteriota bacterium]